MIAIRALASVCLYIRGYGGIALGIPYIAWDMVGLFIFVIVHEVLRCPLLLDHIECRLHHWSRVLLLAALRTD